MVVKKESCICWNLSAELIHIFASCARLNKRSSLRWKRLMKTRRKKTRERGPNPEAPGGWNKILKYRTFWKLFFFLKALLTSFLFVSRRKTRSPSPRRRSPAKRERKRSPSHSPRRKLSPAATGSPPPLMQLSTKPLEQVVEPEVSGRATPEPVVQATTRFVKYLKIC